MKKSGLLLLSIIFLIQCAAYKELKPKPELTALAKDFIELKNAKKQFELDKDKKYFVAFPPAQTQNYFLVLDISDKNTINSYLTDTFDDGKGRIIEIKDESTQPDQSVYAIDNTVQKYFWVIDLVHRDIALKMEYRYVEQWRFHFENKYASFLAIFKENKADSSGYLALGNSAQLDVYDFESRIENLQNSLSKLNELKTELKAIEDIFPAYILNTTDEAYQNYVVLKKNLETELQFQGDYLFTLNLFNNLKNAPDFADHVQDYQTYYQAQENYPTSITEQLTASISTALPMLSSYYSTQLKSKNDANTINVPVEELRTLASQAQIIPAQSFNNFANFVSTFNGKTKNLEESETTYNTIKQSVDGQTKMPSNTFFSKILTGLSKLQYQLPSAGTKEYKSYSNYNCVTVQTKKINSLRWKVSSLLEKYRRADTLIPEINALKAEKNYSGMLAVIKKNENLPFLKNLYKDLDRLSLDEQKQAITNAFKTQNWARAERALRTLHNEKNFLNPKTSTIEKNKITRAYNDSLFNRIERASLSRAKQLASNNVGTFNNVEEIYQDQGFLPVYEPTFSVNGSQDAQTRNRSLYKKLDYIKHEDYPSKAITQLYSEFTTNPDNEGVLKARAVVVHGSQYKGSDLQIKKRVGECDPWASKWITQAKKYRKVYALPTTDNTAGENVYVFRLNIRIPTKAKFPVYDLNIKLPKDVAKQAASEQWYEKILLNKKPVKNEGRYTVTAPTAANDYEFQITPVRMLADQDNILEIHYKHKSFKAFQVSVMTQKPIIKKN